MKLTEIIAICVQCCLSCARILDALLSFSHSDVIFIFFNRDSDVL